MTMKTQLAFFFFLSCVFANQEASAPVLVENEPLHHVVLKNESVIVLHLTLPPGERTLYHTHSHDRVAVNLSSTSITQQTWNETEGQPSSTAPGTISVYTLAGSSFTHRVHNIGSAPFDVIDVELLERPATPSSSVAAAIAGENPSARVYSWALAPGAVSGDAHPCAALSHRLGKRIHSENDCTRRPIHLARGQARRIPLGEHHSDPQPC